MPQVISPMAQLDRESKAIKLVSAMRAVDRYGRVVAELSKAADAANLELADRDAWRHAREFRKATLAAMASVILECGNGESAPVADAAKLLEIFTARRY